MAIQHNIDVIFSKLHNATVTRADLDYEGSITIDRDLMDAANMLPHQRVSIYNNTNGERIETYIIEGARGSGEIGINGAAAHRVRKGDSVIIVAYTSMDYETAKSWEPTVVLMDKNNRPKSLPKAA